MGSRRLSRNAMQLLEDFFKSGKNSFEEYKQTVQKSDAVSDATFIRRRKIFKALGTILVDHPQKLYDQHTQHRSNSSPIASNTVPPNVADNVLSGLSGSTPREKIIKKLWECKDTGITTDELCVAGDTKKPNVYSIIARIKEDYKLKSVNDRYYISEKKHLPAINVKMPVHTADKIKGFDVDINLSCIIDDAKMTLEPKDLKDFTDLVKQSLFYKFSALSLIQANKITHQIQKQLISEKFSGA